MEFEWTENVVENRISISENRIHGIGRTCRVLKLDNILSLIASSERSKGQTQNSIETASLEFR